MTYSFSDKIRDDLHVFACIIDCGYKLDLPHLCGLNSISSSAHLGDWF